MCTSYFDRGRKAALPTEREEVTASALKNGFNAYRSGDAPDTKQLSRVCSTKKCEHILPYISCMVNFFIYEVLFVDLPLAEKVGGSVS